LEIVQIEPCIEDRQHLADDHGRDPREKEYGVE
jgi:hypothetical protein